MKIKKISETEDQLAPAICKQEEPMASKRLSRVTCPKCGQSFRLEWRHDEEHFPTIWINRSPDTDSNIRGVRIECPYCDYEEEL